MKKLTAENALSVTEYKQGIKLTDMEREQYLALKKQFAWDGTSYENVLNLFQDVKAVIPANERDKKILDCRIYVYKIIIGELDEIKKKEKAKKEKATKIYNAKAKTGK